MKQNMMKRMILSFALAMIAWVGYAQDIKGKWLTEAGDAQVEIYESNGKMNGKIVWLEKGPDTKDVHNKDEKLRSRKLMGVNILSGLTKKEDKYVYFIGLLSITQKLRLYFKEDITAR